MKIALLMTFFLTSCSLFKISKVSKDLSVSSQKICLSSEGKGRLNVKGRKYIFSYESGLLDHDHSWKLALKFPLRKAEIFEIDWSNPNKVKFTSTIEDKILRENRGVNPKSIEIFTSQVGHLLKEVLIHQSGRKEQKVEFDWKADGGSLLASKKDSKFKAKFTNIVAEHYFGRMSLSYVDITDEEYSLDLIVRNCSENDSIETQVVE